MSANIEIHLADESLDALRGLAGFRISHGFLPSSGIVMN